MTKETIRIGTDQTVEIVEIKEFQLVVGYNVNEITEINQGMTEIIGNDFRRGSFRDTLRTNLNFRGQNYKGRYRENYRNDRGRGRSRERQYQGNIRRNDRSSSSRSRSGSRAGTNRDRIRCSNCREYDHFAKDCPTSKLEKETEKIQQTFNMEEQQTALKTLATDTYDSLNQVSFLNETAQDHLNL